MDKGGSGEPREEATAAIQTSDGGDLDLGNDSRNVEKYQDE